MRKVNIALIGFLLAALLIGCAGAPAAALKSRAEAIPAGAVKMSPAGDGLPPIMRSGEFDPPVPLGSGVNTAGGEDSAFILPDGNTLYFFFTPDVNIPAEKQLFDGATGIWVSHKAGGSWQPAERVVLQDGNELALDGAPFVRGNSMWFASARKGNFRGVDLWTAEFRDGRWSGWKNAGKRLNADYEAGEMHISADGNDMYFHSPRAGGQGVYDIWVSSFQNGEWQSPSNVAAVNSAETDGWPFLTQVGKELWLTRVYRGSPAIFRSKKSNGQWSRLELVVEQFAAEPSLDNAGNLYFTHHFFKDNKMIEADIYIAPRKSR
jgi:hypothetical protein